MRTPVTRTPSVARVAADRAGVRHVEVDLDWNRPANSIFGHAAPSVLVGVERVDQRPQPARRDGGVVVDEGDEVELAGRSDAEVAAAGEPGVGERLDDPHGRAARPRTRSTTSSSEPLSTITISSRSAGQSVARSESRQSIVICPPSKLSTTTRTNGVADAIRGRIVLVKAVRRR